MKLLLESAKIGLITASISVVCSIVLRKEESVNDKQEQQTQATLRLPDSFLEQVDKIAERMSEPGMKVTRAEVLRIALFRGVKEIEADRKKR